MTDWHAVKKADYAVPQGRDARPLVEELCRLLASPDPVERDEVGYSVLATWLGRDRLDPDLCRRLGDEMADRLSAEDIWVRSFAALILDALVSYGTFDPAWVQSFERWYADETDLRGNDPDLGWLHAVAHGADLLGTLGLRAEVDPVAMLDLAARRLVAPTDMVWRDGEDVRLGHAIAADTDPPRAERVGVDRLGADGGGQLDHTRARPAATLGRQCLAHVARGGGHDPDRGTAERW